MEGAVLRPPHLWAAPKRLILNTVNDRVRINKYKNIFSKGYNENWSREVFIIESVLKTNPWTYKPKDFNGERIIGNFYEKGLLLSILYMSYYPEPDSHTRDKVKVVLDLSSYATKKELDHAKLINLI